MAFGNRSLTLNDYRGVQTITEEYILGITKKSELHNPLLQAHPSLISL